MLGDEAAIVTWKKDLQKAKEQEIIKADTAQINIQWIYDVYILGLKYSMPSPETGEWQADTNLFLVYIYTILTISQGTLTKVYNKLNSKYLNDLKTMKVLTNEDIEEYKNFVRNCNLRLGIYEITLKKLFNIPYKETNPVVLRKYFPKFVNLTKSQIDVIKYAIIDPLFFGKFHNVYGKSSVSISCNISSDGEKNNCKLYPIPQFPFPTLDEKGFSSPDCIKPLYIYNEIAFNIKTSIKMLNTITWYDKLVATFIFGQTDAEFIGWNLKAGEWIKDKIEDTKQFAGDVSDAAKALAGNMYEATKSAANFFTSGPSGDSITKTALKVGMAGLIGYLIIKEIG